VDIIRFPEIHGLRAMLTRVMLSALALGGCVMNPLHSGTIVDLTYPFDEHTVYWPTNESFHWKKTSWGPTSQGYWYASAVYSASEHGGTHMDAPIHFSESGWSVDEIPVDPFTGAAFVLVIRAQVSSTPDYTRLVDEIAQWESSHGRVPPNGLLLLVSGWGRYGPGRGG
jgi:kynurenine formamidase